MENYYVIEKCEKEFIGYYDKFQYKEFMTYGYDGDIFNEEVSKRFDTEEEALEELKKYRSSVWQPGSDSRFAHTRVTEYAVIYNYENGFDGVAVAPLED